MRIARHRTAIQRHELSRPMRLAVDAHLITRETRVLDYGCGYGDDLRHLRRLGVPCTGWDPVHRPQGQRQPAAVVNLGYVVNVIEDTAERATVLREAWALTQHVLIVSARLTVDAQEGQQTPYHDGYLTRWGTFQKYYQQHELRAWIDITLGVSSVPAGPGIFYVFREADRRHSFLAARYRRQTTAPHQRSSDRLFEQYKTQFEALMAFLAVRGRLPEASEATEFADLCAIAGSLPRAFAILRRVTGAEQWDRIREERAQDLLVYLALARFTGRSHFSELPLDLQGDVRAFSSTYRRACSDADALLFSAGNPQAIHEACRTASVGKQTPQALYVHVSALPLLPPVLRVYEGCARAYIGAVEGANIIKLHRGTPQISYLSYPDFECDPHPVLTASLLVPLQTFRIQYRDYSQAKNPPILHRKEAFLSPGHPLYAKFARLTRQEECWKLYETPAVIGTRDGWRKVLEDQRVRLAGHKLIHQPLQ